MVHAGRAFSILGIALVAALIHSWILPISISAADPSAESRAQKDQLLDPASASRSGEADAGTQDPGDPSAGSTGGVDPPSQATGDKPPADDPESGDGAAIPLEEARILHQNHVVGQTDLVIFLDAREKEGAYEEGHIWGARKLTSDMILSADLDGQELIGMMLPEQQIVIYCGGGDCDESHNLRTLLVNDLGFQNVWIFEAGYPAWIEAGLPIATGESPFGE